MRLSNPISGHQHNRLTLQYLMTFFTA